jgi:hypothetical protein
MLSENRFIAALICIAACLSFTLWCHVVCFLGYENWDTAYVSLLELPLIAFYLPFVSGSRLAAIGIGMTMAFTGALWIYYLHHIIVEEIGHGRHGEHALPVLLVSLFVLMKITVAYNCLFSSTFRCHLKTIRNETAELEASS